MIHDDCHPDVSSSDWVAFRNEASPYLIEKVLDRSQVRPPDWCLPLARGAAIASPYLLREAGYRPGCHRPRGWKKPKPRAGYEEVFKDLGRDCLIVVRCPPFWRITMDRGMLSRPHNHPNFALVHMFGSTPILTRTYQEAAYLAELCYEKGLAPLYWVHECPDDMWGAINFSMDRQINETRAMRSAI